ncbi:outer membrane protein TolC [Pelomonas saccharophila]|uniref:Outer membrane protein TolC n=1 Tax=Roseateles saccharophilus TaxID=304 RepID=A0ABU1YW30_ROSSA|nr:TolC family protein [Roseateles saccharophilus]MDR7272186.1 outer membrane protein TolC [Roseateles saccharophilus]
MLYPVRPLIALGFAVFGSLALAQSRPAKTAAPPPAPVAEAPASQGRCNEDDAGLSRLGRDMSALDIQNGDPRAALQSLIDKTLSRSKALGAVRLLADAARSDLEETRALGMPTASLNVGINGVHQSVGSTTVGRGGQLSATLSAGMPVWDAGRIAKLTEWRKELAEVASQGQRSAEEQLSLNVVTLALDRSRYVLQGQVYTQYVRKMACLVDALEIITKADRGRASELVQAQKSLQQADLSLEQTMSALRQTEVRMKRLVGEPLPPSIGMTAQLSVMPDLEQMQSDILLGADVAQAEAQARSQRSFAESVIAGQKPSVNLTGSASAMFRSGPGESRSNDIGAGVSVTIPILQPGAHAQASAAVQRYRATVLQRDEAIEAKRYRLLEMNEVGTSTLDRARRIVEILRNSDRVRASTLQQWQQLGRRSLFDVMAAEGDYYSMRVAHVNAMFDAQQIVALIWSMGRGVSAPLR